MGSWLEAIETSILHVNDNSFAGPLIIGTFEKQAPGPPDRGWTVWGVKIRYSLVKTSEW